MARNAARGGAPANHGSNSNIPLGLFDLFLQEWTSPTDSDELFNNLFTLLDRLFFGKDAIDNFGTDLPRFVAAVSRRGSVKRELAALVAAGSYANRIDRVIQRIQLQPCDNIDDGDSHDGDGDAGTKTLSSQEALRTMQAARLVALLLDTLGHILPSNADGVGTAAAAGMGAVAAIVIATLRRARSTLNLCRQFDVDVGSCESVLRKVYGRLRDIAQRAGSKKIASFHDFLSLKDHRITAAIAALACEMLQESQDVTFVDRQGVSQFANAMAAEFDAPSSSTHPHPSREAMANPSSVNSSSSWPPTSSSSTSGRSGGGHHQHMTYQRVSLHFHIGHRLLCPPTTTDAVAHLTQAFVLCPRESQNRDAIWTALVVGKLLLGELPLDEAVTNAPHPQEVHPVASTDDGDEHGFGEEPPPPSFSTSFQPPTGLLDDFVLAVRTGHVRMFDEAVARYRRELLMCQLLRPSMTLRRTVVLMRIAKIHQLACHKGGGDATELVLEDVRIGFLGHEDYDTWMDAGLSLVLPLIANRDINGYYAAEAGIVKLSRTATFRGIDTAPFPAASPA